MFVVEPAEEADAPDLVRLADEELQEHFEAEWLHAQLIQGSCIVAREPGTRRVLGFALAAREPACEAHMKALAVKSNSRHAGIGSALLRSVEENLRRGGTFRLHLEVRAEDRASQNFYSRHGFRPEGWADHAYSDGGDAVLMSRPL